MTLFRIANQRKNEANYAAIHRIFQVKTNQNLKQLGYAQICSGSEGVNVIKHIRIVQSKT